nr:putative inorganic carbon transporter subunit DabA [Flavobacterium covae]
MPALHDTTRDEIEFYDEKVLTQINLDIHIQNKKTFEKALDKNAVERSRRFEIITKSDDLKKIHNSVKRRSVSLFEPRPELNHATNAMCIVGRRTVSEQLFLDRRSFLNSFDYKVDPKGDYLAGILNAVAPVGGGINLEYYFSRVDNHKLGAGSKLPHNVMGLIGVANGIDGDLRPGLPNQMIEVHDPVRLLVVVEHFPEVVKYAITKNSATYEWFYNEWVNLVVLHPETKQLFRFIKGSFELYKPLKVALGDIQDILKYTQTSMDNLKVGIIK